MSSIQIRVCGRYRIDNKIYEGKKSTIFTGKNVQADSLCAIKMQSNSSDTKFLRHQALILERLQGGAGIPNLIWHNTNGDFYFLVRELLGNCLEEYLDICNGKFSLKTTLMIGDKILSCIQQVHLKGIIHKDITPSNFLVGLGRKLHQIYAIDFAQSATYEDAVSNSHLPDAVNDNQFVGTLKFSSLNVLQGHKNSRRDDLQSIGLMMIYFLKGELPWSHATGIEPLEVKKSILSIQQKITLKQLCTGLPEQILKYMEYVRKLTYEEEPNYTLLKRWLRQLFIKQGFEFDHIYDWILIPLKLSDKKMANRIPINKYAKKQSSDALQCNYLYDFKEEFKFYEEQLKVASKKNKDKFEINSTNKIQSKDQNFGKKRSRSIIEKTTSKKGNKDDCEIF